VLAACSIGPADNSPQAQCERQADDDPAVAAIYSGTNGAYTYVGAVRDDLIAAKRQAVMRCMRAKGLAPPGGVQPVHIH
jgi:hypothetical protein